MKFCVFMFLCTLGLPVIGQVNLDAPLRKCQLNSQLIKIHGIKSLIVYADLGPDGVIEGSSISGKISEYEFDSIGNTMYRITCDGHGNYPFVEYGRGSEIEFSNYNSQNLRVYWCNENYRGISEISSEFDVDGNLIEFEYINEGKNTSGHTKRSFEWRDGKMVQMREILPTSKDSKITYIFDEAGRCIERVGETWRSTDVFSMIGDTITQVESYYRHDTLVSIQSYSYLKQFEDRYVYYSKKNHKKELESEMKVIYDEDGNTISYFSKELTKEYDGEKMSSYFVKTQIEVDNEYDEHDFLIKQQFYRIKANGKKLLSKVYRYVYETTPLNFKFKQGELRAKEVEMNESYGIDY